MNIRSVIHNALYFIPVIGTGHHARVSLKLHREYQELLKIAPLMATISSNNHALTKIRNDRAYSQINQLSPEERTRVTRYFADVNQNDQLGFWGSAVQCVICIAARVLFPWLNLYTYFEGVHMGYSCLKLASGPNLYYYDADKKYSHLYRKDYMGESAIFGKEFKCLYQLSLT